jgi:hypothetical protein
VTRDDGQERCLECAGRLGPASAPTVFLAQYGGELGVSAQAVLDTRGAAESWIDDEAPDIDSMWSRVQEYEVGPHD